eukprot:TRINITY_DN33325_c0_g1_i1.p1 TRINITY_DN33325_c0_g1~~TRINITY_DN33325_c0_g1_i1.p1  ORF type:complete len:567 (+),score=89.03 TRINITY_DN33325_c0_g1_i1:64-1764(+)
MASGGYSCGAETAGQGATFINPIVPGGFPDPSICLVDDTFYLCNSSFEYFPGLPIHKSKDLVNWEWVGYGLHRREQVSGAVNLVDVKSDDGIQAPSIRYHKGIFYIIVTNVYRPPDNDEGTCTNFIITATDINGPWSDPHVIDGAPGIDPDIFFDDDGKVWYVGTSGADDPRWGGEGEVYVHELDLNNWKLVGERSKLWRGALFGGVFIEGPHMYKIDGMYYLMAAEGGTGVNHAVVIATSDKVTGPFWPNERNPILTSRHLSYDNWVHSTGHADLFKLPDGRWYMACLGIRADVGEPKMKRSNMGRETHLVPVQWEQEPQEWSPIGPPGKRWWPVPAPSTGRVERRSPLPMGKAQLQSHNEFFDGFDAKQLHPEWNFRRVPKDGAFSLTDRAGHLRLFAQAQTIQERKSCSLLGFRQRQSEFTYLAEMEFCPKSEGSEAGVCLFQKDENFVKFTVELTKGSHCLSVALKEKEKELRVVAAVSLEAFKGKIHLRLCCKPGEDEYRFAYSLDAGSSFVEVHKGIENHLLMSFGYTGSYLGLYCTSNGKAEGDYADFDSVKHQAFVRE